MCIAPFLVVLVIFTTSIFQKLRYSEANVLEIRKPIFPKISGRIMRLPHSQYLEKCYASRKSYGQRKEQ